MDFKTPMFKHQRECFEAIKRKKYFALFLEPGLGKSKITLDTISFRKTVFPSYTTLVVCPNTLVENWEDEVHKHSNLSVTSLTGASQRRCARLRNNSDVFIVNYESTRIITDALLKKKFDLLVLDESTAVKNHKSQQSKACYKLSQHIEHKLILTGTPVMNSPLDIFGQYRILNPDIFGRSHYRFKHRYAIFGGYGNFQVLKWINMIEFKERVGTCAIRRTKDECLDLPEKLYQVVKLDLPDEQKRHYKELRENFVAEYKEKIITASNVLTRLIRFSQITAGFIKDVEGVEHEFSKNPKVDWLLDFMGNLGADRKVIVFCRFIHEIKMVERALAKHGYQFVTVMGGVKDRLSKVKDFNENPKTRAFIGQISTTGMGINLTSAQYVVFLTNSYSYGERVQAEDRAHRIGQSKNVTYIDVLMRGTIDVHIHRVLGTKQSLSNMVVSDLVDMV